MPISTKTQSARPLNSAKTATEISSLRQTRSRTAQDSSKDDNGVEPERPVVPSRPTSVATAARSLPRLATKTVPKPAGHTRTTSGVTSMPTRSTAAAVASKDATSLSGIARLAGHSRQQSTSATVKNGLTSKHTRTVSTSATSSASASVAPSKSKLTPTVSKAQVLSRKPKDDALGTTASKASDGSETQTPTPRLREELFQLALVYEPAASNLQQYKNSAHEVLLDETDLVKQLQSQVRSLEAAHKEVSSSKALKEWLDARPSGHTSHRIQSLSHTITELDQLFNDHAILVPLENFDQWLAEALVTQEDRLSATGLSEEMKIVKPLGHQWSEQMHSLLRVFQMHRSTITDFGEPSEPSGIALILNRYRRLVNTLVDEIETALAIERLMSQLEASWEQTELDRIVGGIRSADAADNYPKRQHEPAWM